MKNIALYVLIALLFCSCHKRKTDTQISITEKQDTLAEMQNERQMNSSNSLKTANTNGSKHKITSEMAYEGVNNYCHSAYDWSIAKDNPDIMYVSMGEETCKSYKVVFRSYTGAFVYFYVDKTSGITKMVEFVPALNKECEAGTINIFDYID